MPFVPINTVADYYNKNQVLYNLLWHQSLHYGFWYKNTKSHAESLKNTDAFIAACLEIKENEKILDVGCGVGKTSIFMAEKYDAYLTGITISDKQLKQAQLNAQKSTASNHLRFHNMDYCNTSFPSNYFDKIFILESGLHANNKEMLIHECARILRPGGRLASADYFFSKIKNEKEQKDYDAFLKGWVLPNLARLDEYCQWLNNSGFVVLNKINTIDAIKKSCMLLYRMAIIIFPFSWLGNFLGFIPKNMFPHCVASIRQKNLFLNGVMEYHVVIAEKKNDSKS